MTTNLPSQEEKCKHRWDYWEVFGGAVCMICGINKSPTVKELGQSRPTLGQTEPESRSNLDQPAVKAKDFFKVNCCYKNEDCPICPKSDQRAEWENKLIDIIARSRSESPVYQYKQLKALIAESKAELLEQIEEIRFSVEFSGTKSPMRVMELELRDLKKSLHTREENG